MKDELIKKNLAWEKVNIARLKERPNAQCYIEGVFDEFIELHGDRFYGDDKAIIGGLARINDLVVTVLAQAKGRNLDENIKRNFGMPYPEGYRKTLRLMKQAEKFNRPIVCFVDTPGAFCGAEAEARGQGEAIARNLFEIINLHVPIISIVIGEGGNGGAHNSSNEIMAILISNLLDRLNQLKSTTIEELLKKRQEKFRTIGDLS